MPTVIFFPDKDNPPRRGPISYGTFCQLKRGRNEVNQETIEKLKTFHSFNERIEHGAIQVADPKMKENMKEVDVSSSKADDILKVIPHEFDANKLEKMALAEAKGRKRVTVLNAINTQISQIKSGTL